ncbi:uncharacterized protein ACBR49_001211 [Aulostomus maculatus]
MSSPDEAALDASPPEDRTEEENKEALGQTLNDQDERTKPSETQGNRDIEEEEDEEFSTSLSVGDGRYLVDLGSSSEFVVDEECILQLFQSCRTCKRKCRVGKHARGLKLVVYQACAFCNSHRQWTNLADAADTSFQTNGKSYKS